MLIPMVPCWGEPYSYSRQNGHAALMSFKSRTVTINPNTLPSQRVRAPSLACLATLPGLSHLRSAGSRYTLLATYHTLRGESGPLPAELGMAARTVNPNTLQTLNE